jgi:hypothetical protein
MRHNEQIEALQGKVDELEKVSERISSGLMIAYRLPAMHGRETLDRFASIIVSGALKFPDKAPEQTNDFLRIAAEVTNFEVEVLGQIYEFQNGLVSQPGHSVNQSHWISNIGVRWNEMNRKYSETEQLWMNKKSAYLRLEGYGFIKRSATSPTSEGHQIAQTAYALLPLGKEFIEYVGEFTRKDN